MPTVKQLQKQLAVLQEENSVLKSKQGFFTLFKEETPTTIDLVSKKIPYFKEVIKDRIEVPGAP